MTRPQRDPTARCKPQVKEIPFSQLMSCRGRRGYWTGRKSLWERRGRTLGRAPAAGGGMCIAGSRTWHITARFRGVLCLPVDCGLDAGGSPVHAAAQCTRHAARASRKSGQYFGLFFVCWSASALLSPEHGGQLYGHFGGHIVWWASAALALLSTPLIYQATRLGVSNRLASQTPRVTSLS